MQEMETTGRAWGGNGKSASPGLKLAEGDTSGSYRPCWLGKPSCFIPELHSTSRSWSLHPNLATGWHRA